MAKEKCGFTGEYNFYVGVLTGKRKLCFVDSIDYDDKTATWNEEKPALAMSKQSAIQLQMGLMCNGTVALVIEAPDFHELTNFKPLWNERWHVSEIAKCLEEIEGSVNNDYPTIDDLAKGLYERGVRKVE